MRQPCKFRKWIELEKLKSQVTEGSENEDFPERVFAYVSTALNVPIKKLERRDWKSIVLSISEAHGKNFVDIYVPIIKAAPKGGKESDWSYDKRDWHYYSHILAAAYGWSLEYIANLEVNDAFGHIQEILTDEHLDREFNYSLSEVAYRFDKASKKSNYVPMKRPHWMRAVAPKEIKKIKVRKDLLPVGLVKSVHGLPQEYEFQGMEVQREGG